MWQYWLIASGIFLIAEIVTTGFLVFWLGIGALIAMCVSFFVDNIIAQMVVFLVSSVILILSTKPFVKKFLNTDKKTKTNAFSIIGKKALVIKAIDNVEGCGQIKVDGEVWSAECANGSRLEKDKEVKIIKIEGVKAIVEPI